MSAKVFSAYKLSFTTPLHIGDNRDDYGVSLRMLSSDAFYAAVTAALAKMGEEIPEDGNLGCVISALFPFYQKDKSSEPVFFFPIPLLREPPRLEGERYAAAKRIKGIRWLDLPYFQKVLNGEPLWGSDESFSDIKGEYLTHCPIPEDFIRSEVSARVAVSRAFEDSRPFYMDRVFFTGRSGLFFLVEGDTGRIDRALPFLSSEGIGTDRNVGNGFFDFEKVDVCISCPDDSPASLVLSTLIPEDRQQLESMVSGGEVAYEMVRRGGWISTPPYLTLRKNAIYAFAPGSVFRGLPSGCGRIVDLAPSGLVRHPVWRCGKAIVLPISSV